MGLSACFVVSGSLGVSKTSCKVKKYFFTIHQRRYQSSNEQLSLIRVSFTIAGIRCVKHPYEGLFHSSLRPLKGICGNLALVQGYMHTKK